MRISTQTEVTCSQCGRRRQLSELKGQAPAVTRTLRDFDGIRITDRETTEAAACEVCGSRSLRVKHGVG